jgi:hypothetical protein
VQPNAGCGAWGAAAVLKKLWQLTHCVTGPEYAPASGVLLVQINTLSASIGTDSSIDKIVLFFTFFINISSIVFFFEVVEIT